MSRGAVNSLQKNQHVRREILTLCHVGVAVHAACDRGGSQSEAAALSVRAPKTARLAPIATTTPPWSCQFWYPAPVRAKVRWSGVQRRDQ